MGRKNIVEFVYDCEEKIKDKLEEVDKISFFNSMKVLNAMHNNKISSSFYSLYMSHYFGVNQSANINMNTTLKTTVNTVNTLNLIKNQLALEEQEMTLEQPKDNS